MATNKQRSKRDNEKAKWAFFRRLGDHSGPLVTFAKQPKNLEIMAQHKSLLRTFVENARTKITYNIQRLNEDNSPIPITISRAGNTIGALSQYRSECAQNRDIAMIWNFPDHSEEIKLSALITSFTQSARQLKHDEIRTAQASIRQGLEHIENAIEDHILWKLSLSGQALLSTPNSSEKAREKAAPRLDILRSVHLPHYDRGVNTIIHAWNHSGTLLLNPDELEKIKIGNEIIYLPRDGNTLNAYQAPEQAALIMPPTAPHVAPPKMVTPRYTTRAFITPRL